MTTPTNPKRTKVFSKRFGTIRDHVGLLNQHLCAFSALVRVLTLVSLRRSLVSHKKSPGRWIKICQGASFAYEVSVARLAAR